MSRDALFDGTLVFEQPARGAGYRVNVDAILLAAFATREREPLKTAFDLGAGAGGVGLSLLHLGAARRVVMIEIDESAASFANRNLDANGWRARGDVIAADVRHAAKEHRGEAQLVVCNPPYVESGRGKLPADAARATARSGELRVFAHAAHALLGRRGRACFVYPARDLSRLLATLTAEKLEAKRMRFVHADAGAPARVVLVEAVHAKPGGLIVEPPFVERVGNAYGPELATLLKTRRAADPA